MVGIAKDSIPLVEAVLATLMRNINASIAKLPDYNKDIKRCYDPKLITVVSSYLPE